MEPLKVLKHVALAGLWLAVSTAFVGNLMRVRAQYAPKEENPDAEDNKEVMGVSFCRMFTRTWRVEGFSGLLRGIVLLVTVSLVFLGLFWLVGGHEAISNIHPVLRTVVGYVLIVLFDVPFSVLYFRSTTVAELLPFFDFQRGMQGLLSPSERRCPLVLYFTPGLFLAIALERAWEFILIPILLKQISRHFPSVGVFMVADCQVLAKIGLALLDTILVTPFQVAAVRLAVQRNEGQAIVLADDSGEIPSERVTGGEEETLTPGTAPVVRLRAQAGQPAYTGLFNFFGSIVDEEGYDALYRVWWFTFLASLLRVFVAKPKVGGLLY